MKKFVCAVSILAVCCIATPVLADLKTAIEFKESGDFDASVRELKPLAQDGNAEAQALLGRAYELGLGADEDIKQAIKLYQLSAAQGNPTSLLNLAALYSSGKMNNDPDPSFVITDAEKILGYALFILSDEASNDTAADNARVQRELMSPELIKTGKALAADMKINGNFLKALHAYTNKNNLN